MKKFTLLAGFDLLFAAVSFIRPPFSAIFKEGDKQENELFGRKTNFASLTKPSGSNLNSPKVR